MSSHKRAPSKQSMESFSIDICDIIDLEKLLEMKQDGFFQNRKPQRFEIVNGLSQPDFNHKIFGALMEVFFHFHEKGIIWEEGVIHMNKDNKRFIRPLLHAVNTMKIFKRMSLIYFFYHQFEVEDCEEMLLERIEYEYDDLCPGLASNHFTKKLEITCGRKMSRGYCLALNNLLQTNAPCLQRLYLLELSGFDFEWIVPGLRDNKTLKYIHFESHASLTDATASAIVAAIGTNPSLASLAMTIDSRQIGDLTSEAFKTLLTNSTSLRELHLRSSSGRKLNAECIIQGLKNSRSLKRLDVQNLLYGDLIFARLFRILPDCPLIEEISLSDSDYDNPILREEDLVQVKLLPRLPRPIKLGLGLPQLGRRWGVPIKCVVELLRCHPEVRIPRYFCRAEPEDDATTTEFRHIVNRNWHGRYLLDRPNVPLSIWPLVLKKVNRNRYVEDKEDKASILYELLQGPAWGKRISFERRVN